MKLVRRVLDRDNRGEISLIPEEAEDMWHVYNLVRLWRALSLQQTLSL